MASWTITIVRTSVSTHEFEEEAEDFESAQALAAEVAEEIRHECVGGYCLDDDDCEVVSIVERRVQPLVPAPQEAH